jgi:hypothetical protein
MPVVRALGRHHPAAAGVPARKLDRGVDCLAAADPEYDPVDVAGGYLCQHPSQQRPVFAHGVVRADVQLTQGLYERREHERVPVPQVEHAPVRVAVDEALAVDVVHEYALASAQYEVDAGAEKELYLSAGHVAREELGDLLFGLLSYDRHVSSWSAPLSA